MRWRFRSRLKSSQALRLREPITRAAAFWHHLVRGLSAMTRHWRFRSIADSERATFLHSSHPRCRAHLSDPRAVA